MVELLNVLQKMDAGVIFIVIMSSRILKISVIKKRLKAKFLVPLVLSVIVAVFLHYSEGIQLVINQSVKYAGTSMVIYEIWKNFIKRFKTKQTGGINGK